MDGHDEETCFKLHPDLKNMHSIRRPNKFGKTETNGSHSNACTTTGSGVNFAGLHLMCVKIDDDDTEIVNNTKAKIVDDTEVHDTKAKIINNTKVNNTCVTLDFHDMNERESYCAEA